MVVIVSGDSFRRRRIGPLAIRIAPFYSPPAGILHRRPRPALLQALESARIGLEASVVINAPVLVLNQNYEPLNVCDIRRAFTLLGAEKAELLERNHQVIHTATLPPSRRRRSSASSTSSSGRARA